MATIGDLLFAVRSKIPDMPPSLPTPTATTLLSTAGGLPVGTYFGVVTQRNPWGETLPSSEISFTVSVGQGITFVTPLLPSANVVRVYLTLPNGALVQRFSLRSSAPEQRRLLPKRNSLDSVLPLSVQPRGSWTPMGRCLERPHSISGSMKP